MNWDFVRIRPSLISESSQLLTGLVKVILRSTFSGPFGLAMVQGNIQAECNKYLPMHYAVLSVYYRHGMRDMYLRCGDTELERKALFQEANELSLDKATKELLDSADRLSWTDGSNMGSIDRWIETTSTALARLRAARVRTVQAVGA